jgi:hypothetical protein
MVIMLVMPLLAAFAVYRIATDLAWESGPFGVFAAMRGFVMVHAPAWAGEGVTCPICWSFWLSLPAGLLISFDAMGLVYWLAIAGAVALAVRATSHDD